MMRVYIQYQPRLYMELLSETLRSKSSIEVIDLTSMAKWSGEPDPKPEATDILIVSLTENGQPDLEEIPVALLALKILAFSLDGSFGYRRLPGEDTWLEIRPFRLERLLNELIPG